MSVQVHIVYLGSLFLMVFTHQSQHLRVLQRVLGPGRYVVSVLLSRKFKLQTTRSSEFMGLSDKVSGNATIESDIIVVVIGSGIWPESKSFKQMFWSSLNAERQNWDSGGNSCTNHFSHFHGSFSKYLNLDKLASSMGDGTEVLDVQAAAKLLDTRQEKEERELEIEP